MFPEKHHGGIIKLTISCYNVPEGTHTSSIAQTHAHPHVHLSIFTQYASNKSVRILQPQSERVIS